MRVDWEFLSVQKRAERPYNHKSEAEAETVICFRTPSGQLREVAIDGADLVRLVESTAKIVAKELSKH